MGERMLIYYAGFLDQFDSHVRQVLLYLGAERLTMPDTFQTPSTTHKFEIVTMADIDGEALLESPDLVDNQLALLTRADRERVYAVVLERLRRLEPHARKEAGTLFTLISGIIGLEEETRRRLDSDMLDIMENKVLGPMIQHEIEKAEAKAIERGLERGLEQGLEQGLERGLERGLEQGRRRMLAELLVDRFGDLPDTVVTRIDSADQQTVMRWTKRLFHNPELGIDSILA